MPPALRQSLTLIGFAAVVAGFALALPDTFPTARNLINIAQQSAMLAVVAAAMTIVMAMGDFDLSVGSMASLAGVTAAVLFAGGAPVWVGVAAGLAVGIAGGILNGVLVAVVGILPFVATLGTLTIFSGAAFIVTGGKTIFGRAIPAPFAEFARAGIPLDALGLAGLRVPYLALTAAAVIAVVWVVMERRRFGRHLYAMGSNPEAARLAGVPVVRLRIAAFALAGLGAAGAGLMLAARVASANPTQGAGLMLDAIAAVFLGMTMTRGGEPRVLATVAGVALLAVLGNGLTQMRVDSYVREVVTGVIVLAAVAFATLGRRGRG